MLGDTKDELVMMLKRKLDESDQQNKSMKRELDELKKGNSGAEAQLKAVQEMHSQKIKTLLKSINNLKKEVQQEKFEKKDNVRIQKIQRLEKDLELMEIAMNALRKHIAKEDVCDSVITDALSKGPKRVRIASREELKIEINKFKNVSLRLMEEIKRNGIKPPGYALKAGLEQPETGLRDDGVAKQKGAFDHLDTQSEAQSQMSLAGDFNEGEATADDLINEKRRLEEVIGRLNIDIKDKNEKIIDLLEQIEDLKINVYSRDKAVELLQNQIQRLAEDLREAKQYEHKYKSAQMMLNSLELENKKLMERLNIKIESDANNLYSKSKDAEIEQRAMTAHINDLQDKLSQKNQQDRAGQSKLKQIEQSLKQQLEQARKQADDALKSQELIKKEKEVLDQKLRTTSEMQRRQQEELALEKQKSELIQREAQFQLQQQQRELALIEKQKQQIGMKKEAELKYYSDMLANMQNAQQQPQSNGKQSQTDEAALMIVQRRNQERKLIEQDEILERQKREQQARKLNETVERARSGSQPPNTEDELTRRRREEREKIKSQELSGVNLSNQKSVIGGSSAVIVNNGERIPTEEDGFADEAY